jgi:hypothetical protein
VNKTISHDNTNLSQNITIKKRIGSIIPGYQCCQDILKPDPTNVVSGMKLSSKQVVST